MNQWPLCAQVGALHGVLVGLGFGVIFCCAPVTAQQLVWMILLYAALAALVSLFALVVLRKYTLSSVLWPTLLNALLVSLIVILVLRAIGPSEWTPLLGIILGFVLGALVGALLCRLCGERLLGGFAAGR